MARARKYADLESALGHSFKDRKLLERALTHASVRSVSAKRLDNERLEFLGDRVLGLAVAEMLHGALPDHQEGELARYFNRLVRGATCAAVGREMGIGEHLILSDSEANGGGRDKDTILADAVEAVLGAMYLDGGIEPVRRLVLDQLHDRIGHAAERPGSKDYKTRLQEIAAHDGHTPPVYELSESGPDHHKRFHATVTIGGTMMGAGTGTSKKEAEQKAARAAYERRSGDSENGAIDDV